MKWHKLNDTTKITTHNLYVFISTKLKTGSFKFQMLSNNGSALTTWRSRFPNHKAIDDQVEIMIEQNNYN